MSICCICAVLPFFVFTLVFAHSSKQAFCFMTKYVATCIWNSFFSVLLGHDIYITKSQDSRSKACLKCLYHLQRAQKSGTKHTLKGEDWTSTEQQRKCIGKEDCCTCLFLWVLGTYWVASFSCLLHFSYISFNVCNCQLFWFSMPESTDAQFISRGRFQMYYHRKVKGVSVKVYVQFIALYEFT